jgi:hypothetical protein
MPDLLQKATKVTKKPGFFYRRKRILLRAARYGGQGGSIPRLNRVAVNWNAFLIYDV